MARQNSDVSEGNRHPLCLLATLSGAYGVTFGGIVSGFLMFGPSGTGTIEELPIWLWFIIGLGPLLLLLGLGSLTRPLYLLVFVPMPTLMAAGFYGGGYGNPIFEYIYKLGIISPFIAYFLVRAYYLRNESNRNKKA